MMKNQGQKKGPADDVILVTGGAGFLGQHIVSLLQTSSSNVREIRVLDIKPFRNSLAITMKKSMSCFKGCVTDPILVDRAMDGVTSVFHIAGKISYGTFPDFEDMNKINIEGTANIIRACRKANVTRLIYCSTVDVAIGNNEILNGTEATTAPPCSFLFPGYPESKYRAECLVLEANGQNTDNGSLLQTISLRANVMYGQEDPYYITNALRSAKRSKGVLYQIGPGTAMFQQAYVGNTAWAFLAADQALRERPCLGGNFYYIPDNTPIQNSFQFMKPFLQIRGFKLSHKKLSYSLVYYALVILEWLAYAISPVYKWNLPSQSYTVKYINMNLFFSGEKAAKELKYKPLYDHKTAMERSLPYYKDVDLN